MIEALLNESKTLIDFHSVPTVDQSRDAVGEKVFDRVGGAMICGTVLGRVFEGELFTHPTAK